MAEMFEKFANIFRIPDLRKRVLFMLGILAVYRLGAWIPTPGVEPRSWRRCSICRAAPLWA
jgi:preprotein translocase subunit SecY